VIILDALEKLYTAILQQFPNERITTKQAADAVGLTRGVTSSYLSKLEKQDKLKKSGTRPVYWQIKKDPSAFDNLIGADGSLSSDIQHALEAIVYPTNGLPIFITGTPGSGKRTFARAIYQEAIRRKALTKNATFQIMDCINYKDQPDKFRSDLSKNIGDFKDKGSNQTGYLYIKNLQSLTKNDQHYLFNTTNQQEFSGPRYIFSATADIDKLDNAYFKSAAVHITLRPLNQRPFAERIAFIAMFLQQQANQTGRGIMISPSKLIKLSTIKQINNIRGLNNYIQLLCAEAYAHTPEGDLLFISDISEKAIHILPNQQMVTDSIRSLTNSSLQLGTTLTSLLNKLTDSVQRGETISEQYFLVIKIINQLSTATSEELLNPSIQRIKELIHKYITHPYGVTFPKDETFWRNITLAFVFANLYDDNIAGSEKVPHLQEQVKEHYPRSHYLFHKLLEKTLPRRVDSEAYYLPFFILMYQCADEIEAVRYNAILLAHGEHTASSIQQVVNSLCGNYFFEAFDMPIDISLEQINTYVSKYLENQPSSTQGNIILFDMGSLRQMFTKIKRTSNQELLVVNNVTTSMALDTALRIQRNDSFQSIAEASKKYSLSTDAQYYEGLSNKKNIIVSCMSGVGLSKELKKLIDSTLSPSLEVIALDYKKLHELLENNDQQFFSNTLLIMTTSDVSDSLDLNIMNIYNIFDKVTSSKLQSILLNAGETKKSTTSLIDQLLRFLSIEGIRGRLQILNPDIVIQDSQDVVSHYENFYNVKFEARLKLNLYMHLSLMFERMLMSRSNSESVIKQESLTDKERDFFSLSHGIFKPVEQKFNIKIQDYEIELLYQLLKDFIFIN